MEECPFIIGSAWTEIFGKRFIGTAKHRCNGSAANPERISDGGFCEIGDVTKHDRFSGALGQP